MSKKNTNLNAWGNFLSGAVLSAGLMVAWDQITADRLSEDADHRITISMNTDYSNAWSDATFRGQWQQNVIEATGRALNSISEDGISEDTIKIHCGLGGCAFY